MKPILVTGYTNPDLDGLAGFFAYAEFLRKIGKDAVAGLSGAAQSEGEYLLKRFNIPAPIILDGDFAYDQIVLVDASDFKGLNPKIDPQKVIEIIDHRQINEAEKFLSAKIQIEMVGAAATLVAEKFMVNKIEISKESAILLYGAIISNTLNFKGSVTTERDHLAAEWLNEVAQLPEFFWQELFQSKSDLNGEKLKKAIEIDPKYFVMPNEQKVMIAQIEMIGAGDLIKNRKNEIKEILNQDKLKKDFSYIFLNLIDLVEEKNYFIATDQEIKNILSEVLEIEFVDDVAKRDKLIMRKQIVPLLMKKIGG